MKRPIYSTILLIFLSLSLSLGFSLNLNAETLKTEIVSLVRDDEGVKIITIMPLQSPKIFYLKQSHPQFFSLSQQLQKARLEKIKIQINFKKEDLNSVQSVKFEDL